MVRIWCFHCYVLGSVPDQGTEILQAMECGQKKKKKKNGIVTPSAKLQ